MNVIRCLRCGGHPMECPEEGVSVACCCKESAWTLVDEGVLFIWAEVALCR